MDNVNQTPESPQVPAGQSPALGAAPEAIEVNSAPAAPTPPTPATPELGGVFKGTNQKKPSKLLLWLLIVLGIILIGGGGYYAYGKYGDQILIKLGIKEATPTATTGGTTNGTDTTQSTNAPTITGYQIYTNTDYGFSFEYPADWTPYKTVTTSVINNNKDMLLKVMFNSKATMEEKCYWANNGNWPQPTPTQDECASTLANLTQARQDEITTTRGVFESVFIRISKYNSVPSLQDWLNSEYKIADSELADYAPGKVITMGGQNGYTSSIGCCSATDFSYVIQKGSYVFELGTDGGSGLAGSSRADFDDAFVQKIAATFQFTDPTADWKTYENTTYGFSVKYPTNWSAQQDANNLTGNIFSYGFNDNEATGVSLNVWNEDIAPVKTSKGSSEESSVILNDITWTILDLAQDDVAHSPASRFYLTEKNGKTFELNSNDSITILNQAVTTFKFTE